MQLRRTRPKIKSFPKLFHVELCFSKLNLISDPGQGRLRLRQLKNQILPARVEVSQRIFSWESIPASERRGRPRRRRKSWNRAHEEDHRNRLRQYIPLSIEKGPNSIHPCYGQGSACRCGILVLYHHISRSMDMDWDDESGLHDPLPMGLPAAEQHKH